jgi:copper(I)-binding protein
MRSGIAAVAAALVLTACTQEAPAGGPTVSDAWVRAVPPGAGMTAGYLTVHNPTDQEIQVITVESDDFGSVELHATVTEDGVARMRREEAVAVPPGGSVAFEPGGRHLMMFEPARPLAEGDVVDLTVILSDGTRLVTQAPVARDAPVDHEH